MWNMPASSRFFECQISSRSSSYQAKCDAEPSQTCFRPEKSFPPANPDETETSSIPSKSDKTGNVPAEARLPECETSAPLSVCEDKCQRSSLSTNLAEKEVVSRLAMSIDADNHPPSAIPEGKANASRFVIFFEKQIALSSTIPFECKNQLPYQIPKINGIFNDLKNVTQFKYLLLQQIPTTQKVVLD
jgi:hypothetical protein